MTTSQSSVQGAARQAVSVPASSTQATKRATQLLTPRARRIISQILLQIFLLAVLLLVIFPVVWIVSMAIDPRGVTRPTDLNLVPANANLNAFNRLLTQPFSNVLPLYFSNLLANSIFVSLGTSLATVTLGASAAYAFSRFKFIGRQSGMLGFIILLMLPATGTLVPLYVMFSAVQVNSGLAASIPAIFLGILVGLMVWLLYRGVRALTRVKSIPPAAVVAIELVVALLLMWGTLAVIFQHSPVYVPAIEAPLAADQGPLATAQQDYDRQVGSVQRRQRTADAAKTTADLAAQAAADMAALNGQATASGADVAALLTAEINKRQGGANASADVVLQTALAAQTALQSGGQSGALAALAQGVTTAQAAAAAAEQAATTAQQNADSGQASLIQAQQTLSDAQAAYDATANDIITLRNNVILAAFPYALIGVIAAAAGSAVLMGLVVLLYRRIEPRSLVNILALAVAIAVGMGFTLVQVQQLLGQADASANQPLRSTLIGLACAFASGGLPFAIWNLKGYFDTIPKELEEAALIDGAGLIGTFFRIMIPLALPAFAITILFSFMNGWTEFILSWLFLSGQTQNYTLAMVLATMTGGANQAPPDMQKFAAMAILISIPILVLFFAFQRWIVSGLSIGGVKG